MLNYYISCNLLKFVPAHQLQLSTVLICEGTNRSSVDIVHERDLTKCGRYMWKLYTN